MLRSLLTAWLFLCAATAQGCQAEVKAPPHDPEKFRLRREIRRLQTRLDEAETNAILIEARAEELAAREKELTKLVEKLRFLVRQQDEQIAVLSHAPGQRDFFKAEAKRLTEEILRLREKLARMRAKLTTAPATRAASGRSQPGTD